MSFLKLLAAEIADRVAEEVILQLRKKMRAHTLDKQAESLKDELNNAQSNAEKEAVLDKVHSLINDFSQL